MDFAVKGTILPVLEASLQPGESVISTHGDLGWMSPNITLSQTTAMGGKSGFMKVAKRLASGGGLFLTRYQAQGTPGIVVLPAKLPGNIISVEVTPAKSFYVHRSGFLCGTEGIEASVSMQQRALSGGFFGGMGFFLQHLTGNGLAWLELSGELFSYDLAAGQTIRVHPGHVGAFEDTVNFSIGSVPGIANKFFGGNGFYLADLTGPGHVWLQSMSITALSAEIADHMPPQAAASRGGIDLGGMFSS